MLGSWSRYAGQRHYSRAVEALLAGLEHAQDTAGEARPTLDEQVGGAEEHRHVGVVTAGVHHAVDLGAEFQPGFLGQRQGVHVAPQQDGRSWTGALDKDSDRHGLPTDLWGQAELLVLLDDQRLGSGQAEAPLWLPMEATSYRHDLGQEG